jgi:NADPH:quinone reductase-like Zn-dependent oxidoreductase
MGDQTPMLSHSKSLLARLMSKIVRFHKIGGPEVLQFEERETPTPGKGEVRLRVEAVGLNHSEGAYFHGTYVEQPKLPSKLGYEAVGVVEAVGHGVDVGLIGKRLASIPGFSMNDYGVLAEQAILPLHVLTESPAKLTPAQGASVWTRYLTAYGALVLFGKVRPDDFVIIRAASSSVGTAAIEMVKAEGGKSIAATRTSAKREQLLALGADFVIVTDEEDLPARVGELTGGKGARLILDPVGGPYIKKLAQAAAPEATIFLYGSLSGQPTNYPDAGFGKGLALRAYVMMEMWASTERMTEAKRYIYERLEDGRFTPKIARTFSFSETREAFAYQESAQHVGKIVITF